MENWSDLCDDILVLIMGKLSTIEDIVYFGAVCPRWRSVSVENRHLSNKSIVVPWLMVPFRYYRDYEKDRHGFYSLSTQNVYYLNIPDNTNSRRCWSSQGWLITLELDWKIQLLNPFSRVLIRLPHNSTLFTTENEFIDVDKVVDVYKLNFDNRKWEDVKSLENRAVFVGDVTSIQDVNSIVSIAVTVNVGECIGWRLENMNLLTIVFLAGLRLFGFALLFRFVM